MKFHHIGIVVPKIKNSLIELTNFLEFKEIGLPSKIESQKVNVCFLDMGNGFLELIEPLDEDSPVSKFATKGGGIHHICFEVKDIYLTISEIQKKGGKVVVDPILGFENRLTAFVFLNMNNVSCNLIEFAEEKPRLKQN